MLDTYDTFLFVQVVDGGGFTAASRIPRISKSTLRHRIRDDEIGLQRAAIKGPGIVALPG
jgi:hypothetical protein